MAYLQDYFWILKSTNPANDPADGDYYKGAANTSWATPKLYMSEGYARSAARSNGGQWKPVKVKVQIVTESE